MRSLLLVVMLVSVVAQADHKKPPGKGFWKILVKPHAKWVLHDRFAADMAKQNKDKDAFIQQLVVETYDVRKVGEADVARLKFHSPDSDENALAFTHAGPITQVAVTSAGAYLFYASADDAAIIEALKSKPARSDPPKEYKGTKTNEGRYLRILGGDVVCMGWAALPSEKCEDDCEGAVCVSATEGVVALFGNWSPNATQFESDSFRNIRLP
jgi:hypothetical protein